MINNYNNVLQSYIMNVQNTFFQHHKVYGKTTHKQNNAECIRKCY